MKVDTVTWKRLGWMVAIWGLSVAALSLVSLLLKWWLTG